MRPPALPDLRKSSGAFDLPSIITGVVVVGILAAGVLAAIFGVIPFAQDRGARQDLSSIRTAEGVAKAKDNRFLDHAGLLDTGYLQPSSTEKTTVKADAKGTCYVGLAKSGTGKIFYSTDARTDPAILDEDTVTGCLTEDELTDLIQDVGGFTDVGAPRGLTFIAASSLEAKATWKPVKGAVGYKIEYRIGDGEWATQSASTTTTSASIYALPAQTVSVRVSTLTDSGVAGSTEKTTELPGSALKNPGFEQGTQSWSLRGSISVATGNVHSGSQAVRLIYNKGSGTTISQSVTIPSDTPVLTYWSTSSTVQVSFGNATKPSVYEGAGTGGWYKYKVDVSSYAGMTTEVQFTAPSNTDFYLDDIALEPAMVPAAPAGVGATSSGGNAAVTWGGPFTGGTPITGYTATAWLDGVEKGSTSVAGNLYRAVIGGLEAGKNYTFTVTASNKVGPSDPSAGYGPVEINAGHFFNPGFEQGTQKWSLRGTVNVATSNVHSGSQALRLTYNRGSGTAISQSVTVPADAPVLTYWSTSDSVEVSVGYGTKPSVYEAAGTGGWNKYKVDVSSYAGMTAEVHFTAPSNTDFNLDDIALEPAMVPSAPAGVGATSSRERAVVTWGAPFTGGTPITGYTATAWLDGVKKGSTSVAGNLYQAVIGGLEAGKEYTFTVTASNKVGASKSSVHYGPVEFNAGYVSNPGFEQGTQAWAGRGTISGATDKVHSGSKALKLTYNAGSGTAISQSVTVPADAPVLTYWSTSDSVEVSAGYSAKTSVYEVAGTDGWKKYRVDLSSSAGKTTNLEFNTSRYAVFYLDDIDFEAK